VNRQIRLLGVGLMGLFLVLFVALNYLQVVHAPALDANTLNTAKVTSEYDQPRGAIISSDGVTLADSVPAPPGSSFKYVRQYPTGSLFGQITGYYSFIYGSDGAELSFNSLLTGTDSKTGFPTSLTDLGRLLTQSSRAQNVTLTLSDRLQALAQKQLAGRYGSVVALDPSTGAILAAYSNPSYDPNGLSQLSIPGEEKAYKAILANPEDPLVPGAWGNRWFPGSAFKIITASAVYDHDPALANESFPVLPYLHLPDSTGLLHNFADSSCGGQILALFTVSCDTGFGQIGLDLGAQNLYDEAKAFGFDTTPPFDLPFAAQSYFPPPSSFAQNLPTLAFSAIGQEDDQATPLEMAMVGGAIADHGIMMTPHVLEDVTNSQDQVVARYKDSVWRRATSAATAAKVTTLMESVVSSPDGTGIFARIPGVEVAAKTGTAQNGHHQTDDWFVAFAPAAHPTIAVAVVLPDQGFADEYQGGTLAAPIAKAMIEAYLAAHPVPDEGAVVSVPTGTGATPTTTTPTTTTPARTTPTSTTPTSTSAKPSPTTTLPRSTTSPTTTPTTTPATSTTTAPKNPRKKSPPSTTAAPPSTASPPGGGG